MGGCRLGRDGTAGKGGGKFAKGQALAAKALELFPETNGKVDFVWYTAGGNDLMADTEYHACENAIGDGAHYHEHPELYGEHMQCVQGVVTRTNACTSSLLDALFVQSPDTLVVQCGYDLPCMSPACISASHYARRANPAA